MTQFDLDDTIAALASAPGPGERGILRISGAGLWDVLESVLPCPLTSGWRGVRRAERIVTAYRLPGCSASLPVAVYLWPTSRSYTGQPMAELHTIGSPPLLEALLDRLFQAGARPARPGEFTLRAFLAGRIDLVQAEAVLGVVDAHDDRELKTALEQLAGGVSNRIAAVQQTLLDLLADLEAGLDFVEEDIEFIDRRILAARVSACRQQLRQLLDEASARLRSTGRWRVVLAGLPNAGKSTLFNALLGRPAAIVSEVHGTTRDYLVERVEWGGLSVDLVDTAGWERIASGLMHTAQELRDEQVRYADLILWCSGLDFDAETRRQDELHLRLAADGPIPLLRVWTKADTVRRPEVEFETQESQPLVVSAPRGDGLERLRQAIAAQLARSPTGERHMLGTTAARCRDTLSGAVAAMGRAKEAAETGGGEELIAIELRDALD
ncbi:MAG TPA: GTP-binding protein, partial [Planctomycetaceae bacterium]|nr:GTP-binding protein [Planctomycetaceae bacterium]